MAGRFRQFTIMQYEKNPRTGEDLHFDESNILHAMQYKSITYCTYIRHDKDIKTEFVNGHDGTPVGSPVPPHWHVCIKCNESIEISKIAEWFNVPENFVEHVSGANAYIECVEYLTHEHPVQQDAGKHLYADSEVKSNHDWRSELELYKIRRMKKNSSKLNTKEYYRNEVLFHGMTLRQVIDENQDIYRSDYPMLEKNRLHYLANFAPLPAVRVNYYVCGDGGVGKGLLCKAIARSLFPETKYDDDVYFEVGGRNATFEGYDGQPVIIWNDFRAINLLDSLGGRDGVFNAFDSHPTNAKHNVKYGSVRLTNCVNIINSPDPVFKFLDELAGEYKDKNGVLHKSEDKGQSYRRFPILIPVHESDFDIMLNKGILDGTKAFSQYVANEHFRCDMQRLHTKLSCRPDMLRIVEAETVKPILEAHELMKTKLSGEVISEDDDLDEILEEFKDYGKQDKEACRRDEEKRFNDFVEQQKYLIADTLMQFPDANAPNHQRALIVQKMLNDDPHDFYAHEELHLKSTPFTGSYRY